MRNLLPLPPSVGRIFLHVCELALIRGNLQKMHMIAIRIVNKGIKSGLMQKIKKLNHPIRILYGFMCSSIIQNSVYNTKEYAFMYLRRIIFKK